VHPAGIQAGTMFVSKSCEPDMAFIFSLRRPSAGATFPE
jgi:hypothetical protein